MKTPEQCTLAELEPYAREWMRRRRASQPPPRTKVERPCPYCDRAFGARELRAHMPHCKKKPATSVTVTTTRNVYTI